MIMISSNVTLKDWTKTIFKKIWAYIGYNPYQENNKFYDMKNCNYVEKFCLRL